MFGVVLFPLTRYLLWYYTTYIYIYIYSNPNEFGVVFSTGVVVGFQEDLPQATLSHGIVLVVEFVESVEGVAVLRKGGKEGFKGGVGEEGLRGSRWGG